MYFAECFILDTRQSLLLPSAICLPSVSLNTLGKLDVCRVPDEMHSVNPQALGNSTVSGSDRFHSSRSWLELMKLHPPEIIEVACTRLGWSWTCSTGWSSI